VLLARRLAATAVSQKLGGLVRAARLRKSTSVIQEQSGNRHNNQAPLADLGGRSTMSASLPTGGAIMLLGIEIAGNDDEEN